MALKAVLKSLDGLDENVKALYKENETHGFVLDVEGVDDFPAVSGLKKKNGELIGKQKELKEQLSKFDGVDLEKIAEMEKKLKEGNKGDVAKVREEYEAKLTQTSKNAQKEIKTAQEAAGLAEKRATNYYVDSEIARVLTKHKGSPELLAHAIKGNLKVEADGDKFSVTVVGPDGQPRIKDGAGNAFGLEDLVLEMKGNETYQRAFDSSGASGSGATGGSEGVQNGSLSRSTPGVFAKYAKEISEGKVTLTD